MATLFACVDGNALASGFVSRCGKVGLDRLFLLDFCQK